MTRLITSWAWGSRAMARSPVRDLERGTKLEDVVAAPTLEITRALGERVGIDQSFVGEELLERLQPALVVAGGFALTLGVRDLPDEMRLKLAPREARLV